MFKLIARFIKDTSGANSIEYAMIGVLISIIAIIAITSIGVSTNNKFASVSAGFN
jgi:Flp pilus assembly pilin Flp